MKVWIAERWEAYEGSDVLGAFHSPYTAMCACMEYEYNLSDWTFSDHDELGSWATADERNLSGYSVYEVEVE